MMGLKRETRNLMRWSLLLCSMIMAVASPVLTAWAGMQ